MMLRVFIFLLATIVSAMADGYRGHIGYGSNGYSTGLIMPPWLTEGKIDNFTSNYLFSNN